MRNAPPTPGGRLVRSPIQPSDFPLSACIKLPPLPEVPDTEDASADTDTGADTETDADTEM